MNRENVRALLVDDDEDYYILIRDSLADVSAASYRVDWASQYDEALDAMLSGQHDAYLIDYYIGSRTGMDLMREAIARGCKGPFIMLTGQGDQEIDLAAMRAGAADYLTKERVDPALLERSIRYAIRGRETLRDMSRLGAIIEATTDFVCMADADGRVSFVNRAGRRMLGLDDGQDLNGASLVDLHAPWARSLIRHQAMEAARRDGVWSGETALLSREKGEIPVSQVILAHRDRAGGVEYYSTIARDLSERIRAEADQTKLATAIEQAVEAMVITDTRGVIEYVNPAFEAVTGYSRQEAVGQAMRLLKSGRQPAEFYQKLWQTIQAGRVWMGTFTNKKKDGTFYDVEATIAPVRDAAGAILHYVSSQRDVSREKQIEEQLRQSQKMEAVGRLAGGVAHDFNNLLMVISGYSELVLSRVDGASPLRNSLEEIKKASQRAASLTRQLLAFSRKQVMRPVVLDVNALIVNLENMLRRLIGEDIELRTVLRPSLGKVAADPGQVEQVVMNLAVNARDAMPHGGRLTIETFNATLDFGAATPNGNVLSGRYVTIAITDTGVGMSDEVKTHLFEPFFTTKAPGLGTGLGLATCFGIVKQSGGDIRVYSEVGRGTTFKIHLPHVEGAADALPKEEPARTLPRGEETILIVEDEPAVRELAGCILKMAGYTVLKAESGTEGIRIAEGHPGHIDLLVTDVIMPQMGGTELAKELMARHPGTKVLFMSGYTHDSLQHQGVLNPNIEFLEKPFSPARLTQQVRRVLDGVRPDPATGHPAAEGHPARGASAPQSVPTAVTA